MTVKQLQNHLASFNEDLEVLISLDGDSEEMGEVPLLQMPIRMIGGQYSSRTDRTTAIIIKCLREDDVLNNGARELGSIEKEADGQCVELLDLGDTDLND